MEKIIGRLLAEGHISREEAIVLLTGSNTDSSELAGKMKEYKNVMDELVKELSEKIDKIDQRLRLQEIMPPQPSAPNPWDTKIKPWTDPLKKIVTEPYDFPWGKKQILPNTPYWEITCGEGTPTTGYYDINNTKGHCGKNTSLDDTAALGDVV